MQINKLVQGSTFKHNKKPQNKVAKATFIFVRFKYILLFPEGRARFFRLGAIISCVYKEINQVEVSMVSSEFTKNDLKEFTYDALFSLGTFWNLMV